MISLEKVSNQLMQSVHSVGCGSFHVASAEGSGTPWGKRPRPPHSVLFLQKN